MIARNTVSILKVALSWVPFVVFFTILITMLTSEFKNPTDEYFVRTILRSCLLLLGSTFVAHFVCVVFLGVLSFAKLSHWYAQIESLVQIIIVLPLVDLGIYSVALFIGTPEFTLWGEVLAVLLIFPTLFYWLQFLKGPIRNLHQFALFHEVGQRRVTNVLSSFYVAAYVDYYFIVLKKTLLPLVFILTVMDYKIMLPKLFDAGLSFSAYIMFFSLIVSLQMLTTKKDVVV